MHFMDRERKSKEGQPGLDDRVSGASHDEDDFKLCKTIHIFDFLILVTIILASSDISFAQLTLCFICLFLFILARELQRLNQLEKSYARLN